MLQLQLLTPKLTSRPKWLGILLIAALHSFGPASPHCEAASKLNLSLFEHLPPRPTMMDIQTRAGTPPDKDISRPGLIIYRYTLEDGSMVSVGTADRRNVIFIKHAVNGVTTNIFPRTGR